MAEKSNATCPKCGKEIREPGRFCPHCAAPLPQPEMDPNVGYWNFYGAMPDEVEPAAPHGLGAKGTLRFLALVMLVAAIVIGFACSGKGWVFRWSVAWKIWVVGGGIALVLFLLSLLLKKKQ